MDSWLTASRAVVAFAIFCSVLLFYSVFPVRQYNIIQSAESCTDCRRHCEWQLNKMNETFNTLIAVCEEKLQKLHGSDMNNAIIREQLHKEILELFWYEFSTFQRLHSTKMESVPQLCSEYCIKVSIENDWQKECKDNLTKLRKEIHHLSQGQRWLKVQLRRRTLTAAAAFNNESDVNIWYNIKMVLSIIAIVVVGAVLGKSHQRMKERIVFVEGEKRRVEAEHHTLTERNTSLEKHVEFLNSSLEAQQRSTEELIVKQNRQQMELEKQCSSYKIEVEEVSERNSYLEYWNNELYDELSQSQQTFESERSKMDAQIVKLSQKHSKLVKQIKQGENRLRNAHRFWQRIQHNERKARQKVEEDHECTITSLEKNALRYQHMITKHHCKEMKELKDSLAHDSEVYAKKEHKLLNRQRELETRIRKLEREVTGLVQDLEKCRMACDLEREYKNRAKAETSRLEREVTALRLQTARLEEGLQTKSYKRTRPRFRSQQQPTQPMPSPQPLVDSLDAMRQEFESRFEQLQSKFDSQCTRDSEELQKLRIEYEETCRMLDTAKKRNDHLERRLASQEQIQPAYQHHRRSRQWSHSHARSQSRLQLQRPRSNTRVRFDDFRTQPEIGEMSQMTMNFNPSGYQLSVL